MSHIRYWRYLLRHRWYVFLACCDLGIPLLGIIHDWSKFLPDEWRPYAASFYGPQYPKIKDIGGDERNRTLDSGHYKEAIREAFNVAWLKHQHRNAHHWQHWTLLMDDGSVKVLDIPDRYRREMLADWIGAGQAMGKGKDVVAWYRANGLKMQLSLATRQWIEEQLGITEFVAPKGVPF